MNASTPTAAPPGGELWTFRTLVARHKLGAAVSAAIVAVMVVMLLVTFLGAKAGPVSDSTTCTGWGSANQNQQAAYGRLYVREHGPVSGGSTPADVIAAINNGCMKAYANDVSDSVNVVQAISGNF